MIRQASGRQLARQKIAPPRHFFAIDTPYPRINAHRGWHILPRTRSIMFLTTLLAALARWRRYRRTIAELEQLDDRALKDLGIARGDIRRVARLSVM
jgi:uncharacterized protein YjiS (DUF1127 family)